MLLLLLFVAERHDNRRDNRETHGKNDGRPARQHRKTKVLLLRRQEAGPAIFRRPIDRRPAAIVERLLPLQLALFVEVAVLREGHLALEIVVIALGDE